MLRHRASNGRYFSSGIQTLEDLAAWLTRAPPLDPQALQLFPTTQPVLPTTPLEQQNIKVQQQNITAVPIAQSYPEQDQLRESHNTRFKLSESSKPKLATIGSKKLLVLFILIK